MVVVLLSSMDSMDRDVPSTLRESVTEPSTISADLERKINFFEKQLKCMVAEIPRKYQKRISVDLCSQLAVCLSDDINFEIIKGLMDIQHVTEKYLYHLRLKVVNKQESDTLKALEGAPLSEHDQIRAIMAAKHKKQLCEVDMKLVRNLDQKVAEQQETLQKAGFPGFFITTNTSEIKVQMFILDFILRLSKLQVPCS